MSIEKQHELFQQVTLNDIGLGSLADTTDAFVPLGRTVFVNYISEKRHGLRRGVL